MHFRWGVALIGEFFYWALLTPLWDPLSDTGGGDPMVADHWFRHTEKVFDAMDIASDVAKIRLATFQLEGKSQLWWDWVKTCRNLEEMTWAEFHGLFMSTYFPTTTRHEKAQEYLELK